MNKNVFLVGLLVTIIFISGCTQPQIQPKYQTSDIEVGGYSGTAFCSIIDKSGYAIKENSITIDNSGPFKIKLYKMRNTFSPYEYPDINLVTHIVFEDKDNSYADVLYIGDDNNLYSCHGGK